MTAYSVRPIQGRPIMDAGLCCVELSGQELAPSRRLRPCSRMGVAKTSMRLFRLGPMPLHDPLQNGDSRGRAARWACTAELGRSDQSSEAVFCAKNEAFTGVDRRAWSAHHSGVLGAFATFGRSGSPNWLPSKRGETLNWLKLPASKTGNWFAPYARAIVKDRTTWISLELLSASVMSVAREFGMY